MWAASKKDLPRRLRREGGPAGQDQGSKQSGRDLVEASVCFSKISGFQRQGATATIGITGIPLPYYLNIRVLTVDCDLFPFVRLRIPGLSRTLGMYWRSTGFFC